MNVKVRPAEIRVSTVRPYRGRVSINIATGLLRARWRTNVRLIRAPFDERDFQTWLF